MTTRVGIIALLRESNTFLGEPTTLAHFEANMLCAGSLVLDAFRGVEREVDGFIEALETIPNTEAVGVFAARAMPYGVISADCWESLMARLSSALVAAGPLDGLLMAPHGATVAQQARDADGAWLMRVRQHVGEGVPIIGTLDLHANVSADMAQACQALLGYRTDPHLDQRARGLEAGRLMIRTLHGEVLPTQALVQIPLCVNIERQSTTEPQGQRLWAEADRLDGLDPRILSASCLYGFPYADVAEMGASVLVVADRDHALAKRTAQQLARYWWRMRDAFNGDLISVQQAIAMAGLERERCAAHPVGLLDMGDNVGGGSAGDGTLIVQAWLESGGGQILAILNDPAAVKEVERCGVGRRLRIALGGKTDDRHGAPIEDEFLVLAICEGEIFRTGTASRWV